MSKTFLEAEWKMLAMANYVIDKNILLPYLPDGTEIDLWQGKCYVSLVGFMFLNTKVKGLKILFHTNFEEVNLRFYVTRMDGEQIKRGVVFIKEIVPKPALALVANLIYKENYQTMPMNHTWLTNEENLTIEYKWKNKQWNSLKIITGKNSRLVADESEAAFITEHYWGYTKLPDGSCSEYGVEHPKWEVFETKDFEINVDFEDIYGKNFGFLNNLKPASVFLAKGSEIKVLQANK